MAEREQNTAELQKFTLWQKIRQGLPWSLLKGIVLGFMSSAAVCFLIEKATTTGWIEPLKGIFTGLYPGIEMLFALLGGMCTSLKHIYNDYTLNLKKIHFNSEQTASNLLKAHREEWKTMRESSDLVLYPKMQYFEKTHLNVATQVILPENNTIGPQREMLIVDSTSPSEWWTNNMLGYLAIQSRWAKNSLGRSIKRVFIWGKAAMKSEYGIKIIQLNRLHGFETYLLAEEIFHKLPIKDISKDLRHEFLVWDDDNALGSVVNEYDHDEIFGYDSPWYIHDDEYARKQIRKDREASSKNLHFLPVGKDKAAQYRKMFNYIISNNKICQIMSFNLGNIESSIYEYCK